MVLVERDQFQEMLMSGFRQTQSGAGHVFLISGEAGIGKSSVARAFVQEVEHQCKLFTALCDSLFSPRPLGPVHELAEQLDLDMGEGADSANRRTHLYARVLQALSQQPKTAVVWIEDIHWADEATLDFIKYFARRIQQNQILLLLTFRDNEVGTTHPFRGVMGELLPGSFTRMQIPPLSINAVKDLAAKKGFDGNELFQVTAGNPFYVTEIMASYSPGVPDNIKDSILSIFNKGSDATKNAWQMLGIVPEGLDCEWMPTIDAHFPEAIESCLTSGVIIVRQNRIHFKHELYRRTMEDSLSPFRRLQLNKKIIELFLPFFEEKGDIERIVHYAKNANEKKLVTQYAPVAAKQAALLGAHTEAARLYLVAIEYNSDPEPEQMLHLYEAYAYECYLINQVDEAIIYQTKALKIQETKNDKNSAGNSLRFLSRLSWFAGRSRDAELYASRAITMLEDQAPTKAKAMAWSNFSQLKMLANEDEEAIKWGMQAIEMAKAIDDKDTYCHALNNVGTAELRFPEREESGKTKLEESLAHSIDNCFHEHAARAYTNIIVTAIRVRDYATANDKLEDAIQYCDQRELHSWRSYILSWKAKMLMETGHWQPALDLVNNLTSYFNQPAIIKITLALVKATIAARTGDEDALILLKEAKRLAFETGEYQRIIPVATAGMEYEWLRGEQIFTAGEMNTVCSLIQKTNDPAGNLAAVYWMHKSRPGDVTIRALYAKYFQRKQTDPYLDITFQRWASCPYETALLLFEGDAEDKRKALQLLQSQGANTVCEKVKSEMRASGIKKIPKGIRASTKSNAAQLTTRELDILQLLKTGAQSKEIAASLFISPKTVSHHISSILFKLEVASRTKAVKEAEALGILK